jgi:hypothetical protein
MAQNVTFNLADTPVPAGTLKMQVTVDLTGFPALTQTGGITWLGNTLTGVGTLFSTELKVGAKISFFVGATNYIANVLAIASNLSATIDLRTNSAAMAVATPSPNVVGVAEVSKITVSGAATSNGTVTTDVNGVTGITTTVTNGDSAITTATNIVASIGATADNGGGVSHLVIITSATTGVQTDIVCSTTATGQTVTPLVLTQGVNADSQVSTLTPSLVVIGDTFNAIINGTTISFVATVATVANVTAGLTAAINANGTVNGLVTAVDMTTYVQVTSDIPGTAFTITTSTTNVSGVQHTHYLERKQLLRQLLKQ